MKEQYVRLIARTLATMMIIVLVVIVLRWLEFDYEDARSLLALFNAYFPEFTFVAMVVAAAWFFKVASTTKADFDFVYFFVSRPDRSEDIYKLGYFALLGLSMWVLFLYAWRDKDIVALLGVIIAGFISKGIADSVGKSFGRPRQDQPTQEQPPQGGQDGKG